MLKSWQRRCFKCKFCISDKTISICLKLVERRDRNVKVIDHKQAEQCSDYEKKN